MIEYMSELVFLIPATATGAAPCPSACIAINGADRANLQAHKIVANMWE